MAEELNPLKLVLKHTLNPYQIEYPSSLNNEDLIAFNEKDPIVIQRFWMPGDRGNAPASGIRVYTGHHRIYVIYKRYLADRLKGNTLIEAETFVKT